MNKVIKRRRYDTDSATKVGGWDNGRFPTDFDYISKDLYRKRTGEFFLHEEGGAQTQYAEACDGGWTSGERIVPLTEDAAKEWAEEHLDADEYEGIFGSVEEGDETFLLTLPASLKSRLSARALADGTNMSAVAVKALESYLG